MGFPVILSVRVSTARTKRYRLHQGRSLIFCVGCAPPSELLVMVWPVVDVWQQTYGYHHLVVGNQKLIAAGNVSHLSSRDQEDRQKLLEQASESYEKTLRTFEDHHIALAGHAATNVQLGNKRGSRYMYHDALTKHSIYQWNRHLSHKTFW